MALGDTAKLQCEWCEGTEAPFHKLRTGGFTCENCYRELEREQKRFEKWQVEK